MKRISLLICFAVYLFSLLIVTVFAHPGKTDSKGGHTDTSTGEYHYHHGYSAHDHYDMDGDGVVDCPYDFDDKTNHSNSSAISSPQATEPARTPAATSSENNTTSDVNLKTVLGFIIAIGIYVFFMFILPFLMS